MTTFAAGGCLLISALISGEVSANAIFRGCDLFVNKEVAGGIQMSGYANDAFI